MIGIQDPVMTLAIFASLGWELHEALVEGEIVSNGVPPALILSVAIVRKVFGDEIVDPVECESLLVAALNRHRYQGHVRVRWLHVGHLLVCIFCIRGVELDGSGGHRCHGLRLFAPRLAHLQ